MRTSWHDLWGCARGPVTRLAPPTRLLAGAAVFAAGVVAPLTTLTGWAIVVAGAVAWVALCRPPARILGALLLLGLALFLPYLLLVPVIHAGEHGAGWTWGRSLAGPGFLIVRGLTGTFVSVATLATLTVSDLHEGLARLPLPRVVVSILAQVAHQTGALVGETRRVAAAMAVRGASGGLLAAGRVLAALPQVWLPRILQRADRVGDAMEVRGYTGESVVFGAPRLRRADAAALLVAASWLTLAMVARWRAGA